MAFWGVEVKPGKPFTHTSDDARGRLHISQATLGNGTATNKSMVQCNVGNKSPVFLCSLFPEKSESCQLNLEFEEANEVVFSVIGPRSVHLTGYFLGSGGRHYNFNDESESYGEDIADTESERSISDEDKYEDSFIDDDDPEVFPPSPVFDDGDMDEMVDRRTSKKAKGSHRRLRKRYQVSESDDDIGAEKQMVANGGSAVAMSDSEREDILTISSLCKSNPTNCEKLEAEKMVDKVSGEAKYEGKCFTMSEGKSDVVVNGEPKRSDLYNSVLPSAEVDLANGATPKKKRKMKSRKGKYLDSDVNDYNNVLKDDKAPQNDIEGKDMLQNLPLQNDETQKTSNHVERFNLPADSLLPSAQVGSENDAKPKKRKRKEWAEERSFEADSIELNIVKEKDKAQSDQVKHDSMAQDMPVEVDQNAKQATEKITDNDGNQSVTEFQTEEKKRKKKKKKKRTEEDMKVMNIEKPLLLMDAKSGSVMDTENGTAEGKLTQLKAFPNGLVIQELETGKPDGKVAASGKKISVHYSGKLKENGQVFDSNFGNTPLKIHLGRKDVVEGLNVGLEGMQVGGKRRLLIPPSMGYGSEGDNSKNVPPNSWLEFEVELVKVHR